ncbi:glycoside hydrolase family 55 protein [Serpula lacrymans var. lacrymans S7.3]|uniref:Glycoside hydrolase family 55 protein n=2 Tax=Serpula lacrymans var. lacrymans TaxID=341189 RepID=F8QFK3_SERL3|nr:glycoside hydrolase family 55 protein [Serpula lacrymans var. lacrymans S7.9]EGN92987.1 glycoside hydrolase family 55 protein [Serpula lacrymans var. lacrymans S7.3]EGO19699.1 glycoside hydrolase family 55 protein [Serpula lacrymans var. lacrymans S7.9]
MLSSFLALFTSIILASSTLVSGLGSYCDVEVNKGTAAPGDPYWFGNITHRGTSAFNPDPNSYKVFRNVKDFGAVGDGLTDDTAAINLAMSTGDRCGNGTCQSSTLTPAIVYFPQGTYLVSSAINTYYYTQMIGDARKPPTLLASHNFTGFAVIDADPYIPGGGGSQWFINQDNFYRSIRNLVIDLRQMNVSAPAIGIHWQVSQSTSLMNIVVEMSSENGTQHKGLYMENGSGGFMGGYAGLSVGNQQFTVRNLTVNNAQSAILGAWTWGWTYQGVIINNCSIGFNLTTGGTTSATQSVGSEAIIDAVVIDTPIFIQTSNSSNGTLHGSLVLNNINLHNVPIAVTVANGSVVLPGGTAYIPSWGQGNVFTGMDPHPKFTQGEIQAANKPWNVLDANGRVFGKMHPQYENWAVSQVVSVKEEGAKGDGVTDDTEAIRKVFEKYAGCKIIFFDAGTYYITDTIDIPGGSRVVGEAWSVILAGGEKFSDQLHPHVAVRVGEAYERGVAEISDIIFSTVGPAPGAIVIEWNIHDSDGEQGVAGMWDSIIRLGGSAGTNMQFDNCPAGNLSPDCQASFLGIHLTPGSSAYFEGTWVWTADHDLDSPLGNQTSIFSGRGILSESLGPVWFIGTASEHAALYQYSLINAQNHWIGFMQTETPYYQPAPAPPAPFVDNAEYHDPVFGGPINMAWGLHVRTSWDIIVFGAGFYSFFQNYTQVCASTFNCQEQIFNIDKTSTIQVYSLSTVGTTNQLSVDELGVVNEAYGPDGFQETATVWTRW